MKHAAIFTRLAQRADPNIPILDAAMDEIAELEKERDEADDALRAVEAALNGIPYKGTYAQGVETLIKGLAFEHTERLELAAQNVALRSALHKLACLGNGDSFGNSVGNCIAQDALNLPNLAESILKRRDATVESKLLRGLVSGANGGEDGWVTCKDLLEMAAEIEELDGGLIEERI